MICTHCHREIEDDATVCPHCSKPVNSQQEHTDTPEHAEAANETGKAEPVKEPLLDKKGKRELIVLGIVCIIAIVVSVMMK